MIALIWAWQAVQRRALVRAGGAPQGKSGVVHGVLGTLAVITRLNFRTLPMPPRQKMFLAAFAVQAWRVLQPSQRQTWDARGRLPLQDGEDER